MPATRVVTKGREPEINWHNQVTSGSSGQHHVGACGWMQDVKLYERSQHLFFCDVASARVVHVEWWVKAAVSKICEATTAMAGVNLIQSSLDS